MSEIEQRIRERAYQLWEQAGRPHERSEEFWLAARQEIEGDDPPAGDRPAGIEDYSPAAQLPPGSPAAETAPEPRPARPVATTPDRKAASQEAPSPAAADSQAKPRRGRR